MLNLPRTSVTSSTTFPFTFANIFDVISNILAFIFCKRQPPKANLCTVNEDNPPCNVSRKAIKSLSRQGTGMTLSFTERVAVSSLFLHRISVVRENLSRLIHNAADTGTVSASHSHGSCRNSSPSAIVGGNEVS